MSSQISKLKEQIHQLRQNPQDEYLLQTLLAELDTFLDDLTPKHEDTPILLQQNILNHLLDAVIVTDMDFHIILWNQAAEQLYGWTATEVLNRHIGEVIPSRTPEDQVKIMQETLNTTGIWTGEIIQERRDGSPIHILGSVAVLPHENRILAINRDISYLRQTQSALHASEMRFRGTFEQAAVGIAHISVDGTIVRMNHRFAMIVGYSPDEHEQILLDDVLHPDELHEDRMFRKALMNDQVSHVTLEKRIYTQANIELWVNMTYSLVKSAEASDPYFICVIEDITERKLAEVALQHELLKNDLILRSTAEGICGFDTTGHIIFVNPSAEQITGYSALEIMGNSIDVIGRIAFNQVISVDDLQQFAPYLTVMDGQPRHEPETSFWRKDGTEFPVQYTVMPMILDNSIQGAVLTFQDISLRKSLQENYFQLQAEQERARVLQTFISDISHDFRTPLSTIGTSLYLLKQATDRNNLQKYIEKAEVQIQRLDTLLEDMLMMIKLDSDIDRHPIKVNINVIAQDSVTALFSQAAHKAQSFFLDLAPEPLYVFADETHLYQAFLRILHNAVNYSPDGSIIKLTTKLDHHQVAVCFEDAGIGIAEAELNFVFDRFYRIDKSRGTSGSSGLGLSIAKRAIENYHGRIEIESELGIGTKVYCYFPLHVDSRIKSSLKS